MANPDRLKKLKRLNPISQNTVTTPELSPNPPTIIANNCWAGAAYQDLGVSYHSPFVGLFLFPSCYIKLLTDLRHYLESPLTFTTHSRYPWVNQARQRGQVYPIGLLNRQVELHFVHYATPQDAWDKWTRRVKRMDLSHPERFFFKFCDRDRCQPAHIAAFDQLDYPNKVCFTSQPYPDLSSVVWIQACQPQAEVVNGYALYPLCRQYFDVKAWFNRRSALFEKVTDRGSCR
jgi:uncharacterized protein (DUF1919 family)